MIVLTKLNYIIKFLNYILTQIIYKDIKSTKKLLFSFKINWNQKFTKLCEI